MGTDLWHLKPEADETFRDFVERKLNFFPFPRYGAEFVKDWIPSGLKVDNTVGVWTLP